MELSKIRNKVCVAIQCFISNDSDLLRYDQKRLPERAITYKLASYLQILFPELTVDCEYNRHGENQSKMNDLQELVSPDIVIHKRKKDQNNLLVIEIKAFKDAKKIEEDLKKLRKFTNGISTKDYPQYEYGLFMFFQSNEISLEWFENGKDETIKEQIITVS